MLAGLASKTGKTRSELIREAIQQAYATADVKKTIAQLTQIQSFADLDAKSFSRATR